MIFLNESDKAFLLDAVKSYLRITWNEEDSEIANMIDRGISYFNIRGVDVNFASHQVAQQLLLDWCRYIRNYKSDEFEDRYLSDILNLQTSLLPSEVVDGGT